MSLIAVLSGLAVALLAPDLLSWWAARSGTSHLPRLLAQRLIVKQHRFAALSITCLVAVQSILGLALSISVTQLAVANAQLVASVPPGFLKIQALEAGDVPKAVRQAVEDATGYEAVIETWSLAQTDLSAQFEGNVMVVQNSEQLERLLGRTLTPQQAQTLATGVGVLTGYDGPEVTLPLEGGAVTVPSVRFAGPRELQAGAVALRSASFVEGRALTFQVLYYPADQGEIERVAPRLAEDLGVDSSYIRYFMTPEPYRLADSIVVALIGFGALAALLFAGFVSAMGAYARPYLASLASLGVPPAWSRGLAAWMIGPPMIVATAASLVALWLGTLLIWVSDPASFRPWVPAMALAVVGLIASAGATAGAVSAHRRLSVRERIMGS